MQLAGLVHMTRLTVIAVEFENQVEFCKGAPGCEALKVVVKLQLVSQLRG
jgi:hypothetical protein